MLSAAYLSTIPDNVLSLYLQLETDILCDIARRLKKAGRMTDTALWQAKKWEELGASREYIAKRIAQTLRLSEKEIVKTFNAACYKSLKKDENIYLRAKDAGILPSAVPVNAAQGIKSVLTLGALKTENTLENMTESIGQVAFGNLSTYLDRAFMQIESGAFNYQQAITASVKALARNGLRWIDYESGQRISIEAGVRRAVLTGVNKTAGELSMVYAAECGSDLVLTSQHMGARPSHAVWQGRVFSRSGKSKKYPDFVKSTGYGDVQGLCGANCRHSFSPYFEGLSLKPEEKIDMEENAEQYELEQEQRYNERQIRLYKREAMVFDAAGIDNSYAVGKVREWQSIQRSFIANHDALHRDYFREKVEE